MDPCDPTPPLSSPPPAGERARRRGAHIARHGMSGCPHRGVRVATALGIAVLALAAGPPTAPAAEASTVRGAVLERIAEREHAERWRSRGLAFVDLPFGLRARYDAQALLRPSARSAIETSLFDAPAAETARRTTRLLESRFTVSRAVAPRIELELSWASRSPLAVVDLLRIEDQRVTAMIRFVP